MLDDASPLTEPAETPTQAEPGKPLRSCRRCGQSFKPAGVKVLCSRLCAAAERKKGFAPKVCACGQTFIPQSSRRVRCTPECGRRTRPAREKRIRPPRACRRCGAPFSPAVPRHVYCGEACRDIVATDKARATKVLAARATKVLARACDCCGESFTPHPGALRKWCSKACSKVLNERRRLADAPPPLANIDPESVGPEDLHHAVVERAKPGRPYLGRPRTLAAAWQQYADLVGHRDAWCPWRQALMAAVLTKKGHIERPPPRLSGAELLGRARRLEVHHADLAAVAGLDRSTVERAISGDGVTPADLGRLRAALTKMERTAGLTTTQDKDTDD